MMRVLHYHKNSKLQFWLEIKKKKKTAMLSVNRGNVNVFEAVVMGGHFWLFNSGRPSK